MGTLYNQPPRNSCSISHDELDEWLADVVKLAKKHEVDVADVIAAKKALELERQNSLFLRDRDIWDEQIAGIGEVIREVANAIQLLQITAPD